MERHRHIVAICGSLRDESKTRVALREALDGAEELGASTELIDLREYHLPLYGAGNAGADAGDAPRLRRTVRAADGVLVGTPIYHGSYSSPLKCALDYCKRDDFEGTTVGLLAVAGGRFPTRGLDHLRSVVRYVGAWVLPLEVALPNSSSTVGTEAVRDPELAERTRRLGREVVRHADVNRLPEITRPSAASADD